MASQPADFHAGTGGWPTTPSHLSRLSSLSGAAGKLVLQFTRRDQRSLACGGLGGCAFSPRALKLPGAAYQLALSLIRGLPIRPGKTTARVCQSTLALRGWIGGVCYSTTPATRCGRHITGGLCFQLPTRPLASSKWRDASPETRLTGRLGDTLRKGNHSVPRGVKGWPAKPVWRVINKTCPTSSKQRSEAPATLGGPPIDPPWGLPRCHWTDPIGLGAGQTVPRQPAPRPEWLRAIRI